MQEKNSMSIKEARAFAIDIRINYGESALTRLVEGLVEWRLKHATCEDQAQT
jgi:hypothetical protein